MCPEALDKSWIGIDKRSPEVNANDSEADNVMEFSERRKGREEDDWGGRRQVHRRDRGDVGWQTGTGLKASISSKRFSTW